MRNAFAPLVIVALLTAACGDALVDGAYRGQELYVIEGWVRLDASATVPADTTSSGPLRLALFWAPAKGSGFHLEGAVEQDVATDGLFPARFRLALFAPPDDELVKPVVGGRGEMAVAVMLAYVDHDGDRRWDRGTEPVVGGAPDRLLVYTPSGVESPLYGALAAGFHRMVPFRDCVRRPDGIFETRFQADDVHDVELFVSMGFPVDLFFDADCDGTPGEWTGVCPPLEKVRTLCRSGGALTPQDAELCGACEPLLWRPSSQPEVCDAWLDECLYRAPPEECEAEWRVCQGQSAIPHPECVELECVCQRVHDECLADHHDEVGCKGKYNDCMAR